MPLAAYIPAIFHSVPSTRSAQDALGPAAASSHISGQDFGELFREKTGAIEASAFYVATGSEAISKTPASASQESGETADSSTAAMNAEPAESIETSQAERAKSMSASAVAPGSPEIQLQARLTSQPEENTDALASVPKTNFSSSSIEPAKTSTSPSKTNPQSPAQAAHPQRKAREANSTGQQAPESPILLVTIAQSSATVLASVAVPAIVLPASQPTATASGEAKTSSSPGRNSSALAQNNSAVDHAPVPPALAAADRQAASSDSSPSSAAHSQAVTHASENADASPRELGAHTVDSGSAELHSSHTSAAQTAVSGATAPSSAAATTEVRSANIDTAAATLHVERPAAATPPVAIPATGSAPTPAPNLYDRIDQGPSPVLLHSGTQHVEVGVHDPTLGWVEIKTQTTAGHVDATLVSASSQTHDSLVTQLPAMAHYLQERDVRVGTLAVHHQLMQPNTGGGQNGSSNSGPHSGSDASGGSAQNFSQSSSGQEGRGTDSPGVPTPLIHPEVAEGPPPWSVSYISVRA